LLPKSFFRNISSEYSGCEHRCIQNIIRLFEVQKLSGSGIYELKNRERCCRAGVVTEGSFCMECENHTEELKTGMSFFLPASAESIRFTGNGTVIFALPEYN
jgi:mannose-6-phosphate isomerase class I